MRSWSRAIVGGSRPSLSAPRRLSLSLFLSRPCPHQPFTPVVSTQTDRQADGRCMCMADSPIWWFHVKRYYRAGVVTEGGINDPDCGTVSVVDEKNLPCSGFFLLVMLSLILALKSIFVIWNKCRPISPLSLLIQQLHAAFTYITLGSDAEWMTVFACTRLFLPIKIDS